MAKKLSYEELKQRVKELEKEAGERLRMERDLLKLYHAVNHSPSAIMITDAHGLIEYVNPKFIEMTGFTADEIVEKMPPIWVNNRPKKRRGCGRS